MTGGSVADAAGPPRTSSGTVAEIYDRILADIISGKHPIGAPIRDHKVAAELGVSRTPVREAMLLLRQAGVLEVVASRYTRVAAIDATSTGQLVLVWTGLVGLVVDELLDRGTETDLALLDALHARAARHVGDPGRVIEASGRFFDHLVERSRNPHLVRAIGTVAHALGVALAYQPGPDRLPELLDVQGQLLEALRTRDAELGRAAMAAFQARATAGR